MPSQHIHTEERPVVWNADWKYIDHLSQIWTAKYNPRGEKSLWKEDTGFGLWNGGKELRYLRNNI